jgi:hypothetical protein
VEKGLINPVKLKKLAQLMIFGYNQQKNFLPLNIVSTYGQANEKTNTCSEYLNFKQSSRLRDD